MGRDSDDRLLHFGVGLNGNHEKEVRERLLYKRFGLTYDHDVGAGGDIYHYTSPSGLVGILQTRTFFFTDCQFLNDYRERVNINEELALFWQNNRRKYDKHFFRILNKIRVDQYEDASFSYMEGRKEQPCRYFVWSLSETPDSLTMWKYYSKNDGYHGYCLGIFNMALTDEWIDRDTGVAVISSRVKYYPDEKQEIIAAAVDRLYSIWQSYEFSDLLDEKVGREFEAWLSVESLFFKDECFADEQEVRYVAIAPTDRLGRLCYNYDGHNQKMYDFRIVNGVLTPYIKMPFNFWNVDECWAIDYIGIGPCNNPEQKKIGIQQFVASLDYKMANLHIATSAVPVRY